MFYNIKDLLFLPWLKISAIISLTRIDNHHCNGTDPMNLIFLRHCQSKPTPDLQEALWPLSESGYKQARHLVRELSNDPVDVIYSSPYLRAIESIRPLAQARQITIITNDNLRERKLTDRFINNFDDVVERAWSDFDWALPACESSRVAQKRIVNEVKNIKNQHQNKNILISSHGNLIGLYLNHFYPDFGFNQWRNMTQPAIFKQKNSEIRSGQLKFINI